MLKSTEMTLKRHHPESYKKIFFKNTEKNKKKKKERTALRWTDQFLLCFVCAVWERAYLKINERYWNEFKREDIYTKLGSDVLGHKMHVCGYFTPPWPIYYTL